MSGPQAEQAPLLPRTSLSGGDGRPHLSHRVTTLMVTTDIRTVRISTLRQ